MAICCWPTEFLCCVNLGRNSSSISSDTGLGTHVNVGIFCSWYDFFSSTKLEGCIRIYRYVKSQQKVPQLDLVSLGAKSRISIHSTMGNKLGRGLRRAYRLLLFCSQRVRPLLSLSLSRRVPPLTYRRTRIKPVKGGIVDKKF